MNKTRQFRHLNQSDRDRLEALLNAGHKQKEIADILGVDKGTISREIKKRKLKNGHYEATTAQHKARIKRKHSKFQGMKIEKYPCLAISIIVELKKRRSPSEIAGRMEKENILPRVNTNSIYKWLYSVYGQQYCKYLCTKRYRKRKQKENGKRVMMPNKIGINERPLGATNKTRYGHFEGDTIVAPKKSGNTISVAIAVERKTNYMNEKISMNSISLDSGIENRYHEQFDVDAYFCDPHSPWQKPHVENNIGLLRRWFIKKGTDFSTVSEEQLQEYIFILNNKYRKSLNYKSAYEVALEHDII
jgi:IS30 family transposase